jgi:hypothetical protein
MTMALACRNRGLCPVFAGLSGLSFGFHAYALNQRSKQAKVNIGHGAWN